MKYEVLLNCIACGLTFPLKTITIEPRPGLSESSLVEIEFRNRMVEVPTWRFHFCTGPDIDLSSRFNEPPVIGHARFAGLRKCETEN